jgi:hypothetical protein
LKPTQAKLARPYLSQKQTKIQTKGVRAVDQVVEHLPNMHKALGSIPSNTHRHIKYKNRNVLVCWDCHTTE